MRGGPGGAGGGEDDGRPATDAPAAHRAGDWGVDPGDVLALPSTVPYESPALGLPGTRIVVLAASLAGLVSAVASAVAWVVVHDASETDPRGINAPLDGLRAGASTADRVDAVQSVVGVAGLVTLVLLIVSAVYVIRWQSDALAQQEALGIDRPRFTAFRGCWAWLVPIWALYGPKQVYNDLWRATEPGAPVRADGLSWLRRPVPALLRWWWGLWLIGSVSVTADLGGSGESLGEAASDRLFDVIGGLAFAAAGVLFVRILNRLVERADRRAVELRLDGAPSPAALGAPQPQR